MSLFRKEAMAHQSERLTGTVSLAQPLSLKLTVFILVIIVSFIIIFLFNAHYARKETVRGFLKPNTGVIKTYASQTGIVERIYVKEGDKVKKHQTLATIVISNSNNQGVELSSQLVKQLTQQINLLKDEINQHTALKTAEIGNLAQRLLDLQKEQTTLISQQNLAKEKLLLAKLKQQKTEQLFKQGYISEVEKQQQQQALLDAKQAEQSIARLLLQLNNQISQVNFQQQSIPQKYQLQINNLKRQQAELSKQLAQVNHNYRYTITATSDGIISSIQMVEGEKTTNNKPLLHIIPQGAELIAELLLPTRSAGFIQQGNIAKLRFDAFPYQRFGFIESQINHIDQTLISPQEALLPISLQEPVYRLKAKLAQQKINAYGKSFQLKSGMLFEADIMLEERTLIEWLLEPIYSLQGRIG